MKKIRERGGTIYLGDDGPLSCCGVSDPYHSTAMAPIFMDRGSWLMDHGTGLKDGRIVAEL